MVNAALHCTDDVEAGAGANQDNRVVKDASTQDGCAQTTTELWDCGSSNTTSAAVLPVPQGHSTSSDVGLTSILAVLSCQTRTFVL